MINVSIVEDQAEMRKALIRLIKRDPELQLCSTHESVDDALQNLPQANPEIVLMDIMLNGKNGIEVVSRIKEKYPSILFLMCTIYEDDDNVFESLKAGASGYVTKKNGLEITSSIKELYRGGSPMSPEIARRVVSYFSQKPSKIENLSEREMEILDCLTRETTYKDVAAKLELSLFTIRNHLHHIYKKLHVRNKTEAINKLKGN